MAVVCRPRGAGPPFQTNGETRAKSDLGSCRARAKIFSDGDTIADPDIDNQPTHVALADAFQARAGIDFFSSEQLI